MTYLNSLHHGDRICIHRNCHKTNFHGYNMELTCRPARSKVPTVLLNQATVQRPCSGGQVQRFVTRLISSTQFQIAFVMSSEYLLFFIGTVDSYHMQPVLRFPLETNAVPLHWGGGQLTYATCTQVSFGP
jgi:hypothetical protein